MPSILGDLSSALFAKYNKPRGGVHVSDLNWCPRQSIAKRLNPPPVTNQDVSNFSSGEGIGAAIQHLTKYHPGKYTIEKAVDFFGLEAHIDLYNEVDDYPIELKTYRGRSMTEPKPHYVDQLKTYMAITGKTKGLILVQLIMQFDDFPFVEFPIEITDSELSELRSKVYADFAQYQTAYKAKNPELARHIMFDENLNWKCDKCPVLAQCQEWNNDAIQARLAQGLPARPPAKAKINPAKKAVRVAKK